MGTVYNRMEITYGMHRKAIHLLGLVSDTSDSVSGCAFTFVARLALIRSSVTASAANL